MKKRFVVATMLFLLSALPAISFSAVHIGVGIGIPIGGPSPVYTAPVQTLQGTVVQYAGNSMVLRGADGSQRLIYLTGQTAVNGGLVLGSFVTVSAVPANGVWYAEGVSVGAYPGYGYSYPYPYYSYPVYPYPYYYNPGFINFGFGFGGRREHFHGGRGGFGHGGFHGGGGHRH